MFPQGKTFGYNKLVKYPIKHAHIYDRHPLLFSSTPGQSYRISTHAVHCLAQLQ